MTYLCPAKAALTARHVNNNDILMHKNEFSSFIIGRIYIQIYFYMEISLKI